MQASGNTADTTIRKANNDNNNKNNNNNNNNKKRKSATTPETKHILHSKTTAIITVDGNI